MHNNYCLFKIILVEIIGCLYNIHIHTQLESFDSIFLSLWNIYAYWLLKMMVIAINETLMMIRLSFICICAFPVKMRTYFCIKIFIIIIFTSFDNKWTTYFMVYRNKLLKGSNVSFSHNIICSLCAVLNFSIYFFILSWKIYSNHMHTRRYKVST